MVGLPELPEKTLPARYNTHRMDASL